MEDVPYLTSRVEELRSMAGDLCRQARFEEAEVALGRGVVLAEELVLGGGPAAELAGLLRELGDVQERRRRVHDAEVTLRRAVQVAEDAFEPDLRTSGAGAHGPGEWRELARSVEHLAAFLAARGQTEEAVVLRRRVLTTKRAVLGPSHPEVATALHDLAVACQSAGRSDEAHSLWREARAVLQLDTSGTADRAVG
ncbi:MAG TPA: tetratricopeptide repeat protein [Acidimicrobiia bacterium]|nr:tetratricopeptide repeat protein [Acidimicrobiia bacterium]